MIIVIKKWKDVFVEQILYCLLQFYSVVCRAATILKTRYTAPGFWLAGLRLFEMAESMVTDFSEKENLKSVIAVSRQQLNDVQNQSEALETAENRANRGQLSFLFNIYTKFHLDLFLFIFLKRFFIF